MMVNLVFAVRKWTSKIKNKVFHILKSIWIFRSSFRNDPYRLRSIKTHPSPFHALKVIFSQYNILKQATWHVSNEGVCNNGNYCKRKGINSLHLICNSFGIFFHLDQNHQRKTNPHSYLLNFIPMKKETIRSSNPSSTLIIRLDFDNILSRKGLDNITHTKE